MVKYLLPNHPCLFYVTCWVWLKDNVENAMRITTSHRVNSVSENGNFKNAIKLGIIKCKYEFIHRKHLTSYKDTYISHQFINYDIKYFKKYYLSETNIVKYKKKTFNRKVRVKGKIKNYRYANIYRNNRLIERNIRLKRGSKETINKASDNIDMIETTNARTKKLNLKKERIYQRQKAEKERYNLMRAKSLK